jgi:hypothetical protein
MKHLLLRHAFRFVKRVIFLISPQNVRSQKALEKSGAIRAGSRPGAAGRDSYLYEMTSLPLMEPGLKGNTHRNSDFADLTFFLTAKCLFLFLRQLPLFTLLQGP